MPLGVRRGGAETTFIGVACDDKEPSPYQISFFRRSALLATSQQRPMVSNPWPAELARIAGVFSVSLVLGLAADQVLACLLLGATTYLFQHLRQLHQLEKRLKAGDRIAPSSGWGIWSEIYRHLYRRQQRHRKRKRKLARYLKQFHQSTGAMPDAVVVLRSNDEIEWFNGAAARLLGLRAPQDVGHRIGNLWRHPELVRYLKEHDHSAEDAVEVPGPSRTDMRFSVRVVDYARNRRLLMARDVSRLWRLEAMRRDFVGNVSHELRTPLTVITGYLETLLDMDEVHHSQWRRSLESMQQQAERMERLVSDLLLLSRLETSEQDPAPEEPVAIPAIIYAVEEDARQVSAEQHTVDVDVDSTLWLRGDGEQLRSVFSNLVNNAVKYTPDGGQIQIRWSAENEGATFVVEDTGVGIPANHLPRLTERFYRVDVGRSRERGGTGLGLAIVKHVLTRHGAELEIRSEVGRGSVFTARFPASRAVRRTFGTRDRVVSFLGR